MKKREQRTNPKKSRSDQKHEPTPNYPYSCHDTRTPPHTNRGRAAELKKRVLDDHKGLLADLGPAKTLSASRASSKAASAKKAEISLASFVKAHHKAAEGTTKGQPRQIPGRSETAEVGP